MEKDAAKPEAAAAPEVAKAAPQAAAQTEKHPTKNAKKTKASKGKAGSKKAAPAKKEEKAEDTEIPMDAAAIKAYSSVIADAAEDSEPAAPVVYTKTIPEEVKEKPHETLDFDPMGSMIQNEIGAIKDASIKAAKEKEE